MSDALSRRRLIVAAPLVGLSSSFSSALFGDSSLRLDGSSAGADAPFTPPGPSFPTQEPAMAREMVTVSHGNVARVRELLAQHPTLARATWDWGFGDWESALGAASHVGNREIAELLLANGARPDLFSAAMLGDLDTVKAFVAARPGCQGTLGPHNITLLAHARAGGERAAAVRGYLEKLGGADVSPATEPLLDEELQQLLGTYRFGPGESETIEVKIGKFGPTFTRAGTSARVLFHAGARAFFPAGTVQVRIRFAPATGMATELTVHDPDLVLSARRVAS